MTTTTLNGCDLIPVFNEVIKSTQQPRTNTSVFDLAAKLVRMFPLQNRSSPPAPEDPPDWIDATVAFGLMDMVGQMASAGRENVMAHIRQFLENHLNQFQTPNLPAEPTPSSSDTYFSKLNAKPIEHWRNQYTRQPYAHHLVEHYRNLNDSASLLDRDRAKRLLHSMEQMESCSMRSPCRERGCRRCSEHQLHRESVHNGITISEHTTKRRGLAYRLNLGSKAWQGNIEEVREIAVAELEEVITVLQKSDDVAGYTMWTDISQIERDDIGAYPEYNVHFHGVVLLNGTAHYRVRRQIEQVMDRTTMKHVDFEPLRSSYRDKQGRKEGRVITFSDAASWCCYGGKLRTMKTVNRDHVSGVLCDLIGVPVSWQGGVFSKKRPMVSHCHRHAAVLTAELDDVQDMLAKADLADDRIDGVKKQIEELAVLEHKKEHREYMRARRRKEHRKQYAHYGQGWRDRYFQSFQKRSGSQRQRAEAEYDIAAQDKRRRQLMKDIRFTICDIVLSSASLMANKPELLKELDKAVKEPGSQLADSIAICAAIVGHRLSMQDFFARGNTTAGEELLADLRKFEQVWPAWGGEKDTWKMFWYRWKRFVLRSI